MWFRVTVRGKSAHVLNTSAGINAIEYCFHLYQGLKKLEEQFNEEKSNDPDFKHLNHPINFNIGYIKGGDWASTVPTECVIEVRVGFLPNKKLEDVREQVQQNINATFRSLNPPEGCYHEVQWTGFQAEGCTMNKDSEMMKKLGEVHKKVLNKEPVYAPVTCTTDARHYQLYKNIPTTCYGPIAYNIHGANECVDLKSMREVSEVLAVFISEWCGLEPIQK